MCPISVNSYDWDWSESEGKRPKPTCGYCEYCIVLRDEDKTTQRQDTRNAKKMRDFII